MMTRIVLGGAMGRIQGKEYFFDVSTPREALNMVNANKPGFINQIRRNIDIFQNYRVTLEYINGKIEHLSNDTYIMDKTGEIKCMRFTPLLRGSGKQAGAIVGAIFIVVGCILYFTPGFAVAPQVQDVGLGMILGGVGMTISGVITALASPGSRKVDDSEENYFFNGPVNTTEQAVPIPLVFGRCKVGSRVISSSILIKDR